MGLAVYDRRTEVVLFVSGAIGMGILPKGENPRRETKRLKTLLPKRGLP